ncbi:glycosyltransferase family 4 protein [Azonexus sp. IMCC34839]|uniref:glycosyltransferase family 4 protein n=1 Tax=Azonexus sp. IMCC34839 TaxID=3133695 RepID=UPI00399976A7
MRIAFIDVTTTVFFGGVQTAVWQLAMALADMGHDITIYGGNGKVTPDLDGRAIAIRTFPFVPRERFPNLGVRFRKFAERLSFVRHARNDVVSANYDWVILTKPFDFIWPHLMPEGSKTRFAFMSGGTDFFKGDRWLSKKVDAFVACSHFNAWQIAAHYKRVPGVIYNGVDIQRFRPGRRDAERREKLGVTENETLYAFAGRVVGWKGMEIAVRALAEPPLQDIAVRLLIIGDGNAKPGLLELADSLQVSDRIIFQDAVPHKELPDWYALADVGIFPSIADEAFGITIAEAMACGLPVIGSYIGGIPEVIGNEEVSGLLVPVADPLALAKAMARLSTNVELRKVLGQSARQRIEQNFTWRQSAERLLDNLKK